jgi:hypothetical protein
MKTPMVKTQAPTLEKPKKAYIAPGLVRYGDVRTLTQAGATAPRENKGGMQKGSSRMVKQNIVKIGVHPLGIGLYLFDYKPEYRGLWGQGRQFGVMAEEVEGVMPEAVCVDAEGFKVVDYGMLGIRHAIAECS